MSFIQFILSLFSKKKPVKLEPQKDMTLIKDYQEENIKAQETKTKTKTPILPVRYKNDNERLVTEYSKLSTKNKELHEIIEDLNKFSQKEFKKVITITMIYRTQEEQDFLYKNSEKYKARKFKSPHQFWHAVDVRSNTFTQDQINKMVAYLNDKYNRYNYYKWTAKCHSVGHGMHFHVQFCEK